MRALSNPDSQQIGMITAVELIFGTIALLAAGSDLQIIRSAPLTGAKRIARHLWRMTFPPFIAGFSFFPRLAKFIPEPLGSLVAVPVLAVLAVLAVLVALIYWMWRIRFRKSFRGLVTVPAI